jgi:hypothetical protein
MLPSRIQKGRRPVRPSLPPSPIPARQARLDSVLLNSEDAIVRFFVAPGEARATGAARLSRRPIPPAMCNEADTAGATASRPGQCRQAVLQFDLLLLNQNDAIDGGTFSTSRFQTDARSRADQARVDFLTR